MIALSSGLPLVHVGSFHLQGCEPEWIEASVREAARSTGKDDWWFASDIVRSLMIYLRERFDGTVISLEELAGKLKRTLEVIGFGEIANRIELRPPVLTFSVADLAREAGEGFELQFFQLLETRLREVSGFGATRVSITGMREAVKSMKAAKYWCQSCRELEREIAGFLRRREGAGECAVELHPH